MSQADATPSLPADAAPAPAPVSDPASRPEPQRHRYRITVAYDGTLFHGWQKQEPPGQEPLRTVAGVVENTLRLTLRQPITLVGASRTDAGVHALGQVAQFDAATRIPVERLADAINSRLPHDVDIREARIARPDFQAISDARRKQYRYRVFSSAQRPLHLRNYVYHCWWKLDVAAMNDAAGRLVGEHDFNAFAAAKHNRETTVRTIYHCAVEPHPETSEIHLVVQGNGFLYNMVRIIAGTLLEAGRGAMPPAQIDRALAERDRRLAGPTLPPEGLWLEWIRYDD